MRMLALYAPYYTARYWKWAERTRKRGPRIRERQQAPKFLKRSQARSLTPWLYFYISMGDTNLTKIGGEIQIFPAKIDNLDQKGHESYGFGCFDNKIDSPFREIEFWTVCNTIWPMNVGSAIAHRISRENQWILRLSNYLANKMPYWPISN